MCPDDSTPDLKHPTAPAASVLTIAPTQILDPYPERLTSLGGVSQYTATTASRVLKSTNRARQSGRRHPFGASVLITVTAQGVLAAAIAGQQLSPVLGAASAVGLLACGLGLVVAEMLQVAGR